MFLMVNVDVIKEGEIVRMSESQAAQEDLFVLRRVIEPEPEQVNIVDVLNDRKMYVSREIKSNSLLEEWRSGALNYKKNYVIKDLIDNFHWKIAKVRRGKNITRKQLANAIEVSEDDIKKIEFGELPKDDFVLVNKIEKYFGISLRKKKVPEGTTLADLQKMNEEKVREEIEKL